MSLFFHFNSGSLTRVETNTHLHVECNVQLAAEIREGAGPGLNGGALIDGGGGGGSDRNAWRGHAWLAVLEGARVEFYCESAQGKSRPGPVSASVTTIDTARPSGAA